MAIGGYGRAELNPHSDIDFMFLHDGQVAANKPLPHLSKLIDGVLYPLWDIGLKVGHSVRSIDDCVTVANSDMQSKTSLIESRLIIGDEALFKKFQKTIVAKCVAGYEEDYIAARLEDQETRRTKYGNSPTMQEPNLKNGCGGLRDFQNLLWMAFFKYRTHSLDELQQREFVTDAENKHWRRLMIFCCARARNCIITSTGRWTCSGKTFSPPSHTILAIPSVRPANGLRNSCATFIHTCGTSSSSPAHWSNAWL